MSVMTSEYIAGLFKGVPTAVYSRNLGRQAVAREGFPKSIVWHSPEPANAPVSKTWGTAIPEVFFDKTIDNSRLVKVADPERKREIASFSLSVGVLFLLTILYTWQHFCALEYGYRIEAQKSVREQLIENNRLLRLEEASLRDPERIDLLARKMGLESPQAGQLVHLDTAAEATDRVLAQVSEIAVVAKR